MSSAILKRSCGQNGKSGPTVSQGRGGVGSPASHPAFSATFSSGNWPTVHPQKLTVTATLTPLELWPRLDIFSAQYQNGYTYFLL